MNKVQLPILVMLSFSTSCDKEEVDPFVLPAGAYDCRGLWEEDPQGPVGNFAYEYNDVEYLGITNGGFMDNGLLLMSHRVYREDCFSTNGINLVGVNPDLRDTVRDFTCFQTYCEVNLACQTEINRTATFEFLDHDYPLAYYSAKSDGQGFYYVITDANREEGFVKGSFGGTLYLDPTCVGFEGYPDSVILSEGHFIMPI